MASMMEQFRRALQRLASEPSEQEAYLRGLGTAPSADELALEFSDALMAVRSDLESSVANAADRLDDYLRIISGQGQSSLWSVSALKDSSEWEQVRVLAKGVLAEMTK